MGNRLRYNNLSGTLGADLTTTTTSITFGAKLTYNNGVNVPTLAGGDFIPLSIDEGTSKFEVVKLTAYTAAATSGTISRGFDGTSDPGVTHTNGSPLMCAPNTNDVSLPVYITATNASWTIPIGATTLLITAVGGGGGGGGGANTSGTPSSIITGGGGGGGGGITRTIVAVGANTTLNVTIGAGGAGAAGGTSADTDGSNATAGGDTTVTGTGISITGRKGGAGIGGDHTANSQAAGGRYANIIVATSANPGFLGDGGLAAGNGRIPLPDGGGGGGGGGGSDGSTNGGAGGSAGTTAGTPAAAGATDGSGTTAGTNGATAAANSAGGGGGGGGGCNSGNGGTGGTGGSGYVLIQNVTTP